MGSNESVANYTQNPMQKNSTPEKVVRRSFSWPGFLKVRWIELCNE